MLLHNAYRVISAVFWVVGASVCFGVAVWLARELWQTRKASRRARSGNRRLVAGCGPGDRGRRRWHVPPLWVVWVLAWRKRRRIRRNWNTPPSPGRPLTDAERRVLAPYEDGDHK